MNGESTSSLAASQIEHLVSINSFLSFLILWFIKQIDILKVKIDILSNPLKCDKILGFFLHFLAMKK